MPSLARCATLSENRHLDEASAGWYRIDPAWVVCFSFRGNLRPSGNCSVMLRKSSPPIQSIAVPPLLHSYDAQTISFS